MRVGWCSRGKHSNKARLFAESAQKFGNKCCVISKRSIKKSHVVVSYGNFIPRSLQPHHIWVNIHSGYLGRPNYHRISIGNYHPGEYIMSRDMPAGRFNKVKRRTAADPSKYNIVVEPWRKTGDNILLCLVSAFNMELFGMELNEEWQNTEKIISQFTDRPIVVRGRKERHHRRLKHDLDNAWAVVTWSSNCAVESILHGVPCFLRTGAAASPMCLTDLSRLEDPYYPDRQQWLQNLACHQFSVAEIINGYAWDFLMNYFTPRGLVIR